MTDLSKDTSLRKIDLRMIPAGAPLPDCLCDKNGRVLAPAGAVLGKQQIDVLTSGGGELYVGPNWSPTTDNPEPPTASQTATPGQANAAALADEELRGSERRDYSANLTVEIDERGDRSGATRRTVVSTMNISSGGFAFECDGFVHEGAEVIATFEHIPGQPRIAGIVRSCSHVEGRRHRVGVEFVRVLKRSAP